MYELWVSTEAVEMTKKPSYIDLELDDQERIALYAAHSWKLVYADSPLILSRVGYEMHKVTAATFTRLIEHELVEAVLIFTYASEQILNHQLLNDLFAPNVGLEVWGYNVTEKGISWLQASGMLVKNTGHMEMMLQFRDMINHPEQFAQMQRIGFSEAPEDDFDDEGYNDYPDDNEIYDDEEDDEWDDFDDDTADY